MYFTEQQLGDSDVAILEMTISRCIVAKILEERGVLPASYTFSSTTFLSTGYNYQSIFSRKARIETVDEALILLGIGSMDYEHIDDGIQVTLNLPGIHLSDYSELFDSEILDYQWQADQFIDENEESLALGNETGEYVLKFTDYVILPHELLLNLLALK